MQTEGAPLDFDQFLNVESGVLASKELLEEIFVVADDQVQEMEADDRLGEHYLARAKALRQLLCDMRTEMDSLETAVYAICG